MDQAAESNDLTRDQTGLGKKPSRRIACVRCRRRKKRCDHVLPSCGQCTKAGLECVQSGIARRGSSVTVPLAYLRQLEESMSQARTDCGAPDTDDDDDFDADDPYTLMGNVSDTSPAAPEARTAYPSPVEHTLRPRGAHAGSASQVSSSPGSFLRIVGGSSSGLVRGEVSETANGPRSFMRSELADPLPADWAEHYATVYFQHIQPQWPFMDEKAWTASFTSYLEDSSRLTRPDRFLVSMVLSVGALVCSSFRPRCPHLQYSQGLHRDALCHEMDALTRSSSLLQRTQGALLLLVHAFHDSSPEPIEQSLSLAMINCLSLLSEPDGSESQEEYDHGYEFKEISERVAMSCHILNEVVSSGWTFSQSLVSEVMDDKILQHISHIKPCQRRPPVFDQLFQLRCIQSKIRRDNKKLRDLDLDDPLRRICHTRLKGELEDWKNTIELVPGVEPGNQPMYHSPDSLFKLYDYSLAILMDDKPLATAVKNINQLVHCCSEACCTFQVSQERNAVVYWTWAALMYQFRLGILILYCCWIAPNAAQGVEFPQEQALCGVRACRKTLSKFSLRWPKSVTFLNVFQTLADSVIDGTIFAFNSDTVSFVDYTTGPSAQPPFSSKSDLPATISQCLLEMKLQKVHSAVISLVEEMVNGIWSQETESTQMQFAPALYNGGLELFNF